VSADTPRNDPSPSLLPAPIDGAEQATSRMVLRLQLRYIAVIVSITLLIVTVIVAYDVYNDHQNTAVFLSDQAAHAALAVQVLRERSDGSDREILDMACELTACPMALLTSEGHVYHGCDPDFADQVRAQGWPNTDTEPSETRMLVDSALGTLSGAWWVGRYDERYRLLVVVPRRPEDEGLLQYMTFAAAFSGGLVLLTLVVMLAASNWMLRRPMVQLIDALTSALMDDVKRRQEAEERAVEARLEAERHAKFLDHLLNASDDMAIVAATQDGTISLFNRVAERILGLQAKDLVGVLTLDQLMLAVRPRDRAHRDTLQPFLQSREGEQLVVDQSGLEHIILQTTSPIVDHAGNPMGKLMIFSDITEQRRVEAELRSKEVQLVQSTRMATLGEMAAGVAHEINQPLNNIGLVTARIARRINHEGSLGDDDVAFVRDKLHAVQEQVARAARIIDHLRTFGRAEPAPLSDIAVPRAVQGALQLLGEQLRLHDIELDVDVPEDLPRVRGDVSRLEQVLINLIVNARFALDEHAERLRAQGGGDGCVKRLAIRGSTGRTMDDAPAVLLDVEDNGPGMSADVARRVFEPFFTTKPIGEGSGLGLSISYGIVREFGGALSVRTEPGMGATFTIVLEQVAEGVEREADDLAGR